jgi:hypothetical protein
MKGMEEDLLMIVASFYNLNFEKKFRDRLKWGFGVLGSKSELNQG